MYHRFSLCDWLLSGCSHLCGSRKRFWGRWSVCVCVLEGGKRERWRVCMFVSICLTVFVSVFMSHGPAVTQFLAFFTEPVFWRVTVSVLIRALKCEVNTCGPFPTFIWNTRRISGRAKRVLTTTTTLVYAMYLFNLQQIFNEYVFAILLAYGNATTIDWSLFYMSKSASQTHCGHSLVQWLYYVLRIARMCISFGNFRARSLLATLTLVSSQE